MASKPDRMDSHELFLTPRNLRWTPQRAEMSYLTGLDQTTDLRIDRILYVCTKIPWLWPNYIIHLPNYLTQLWSHFWRNWPNPQVNLYSVFYVNVQYNWHPIPYWESMVNTVHHILYWESMVTTVHHIQIPWISESKLGRIIRKMLFISGF